MRDTAVGYSERSFRKLWESLFPDWNLRISARGGVLMVRPTGGGLKYRNVNGQSEVRKQLAEALGHPVLSVFCHDGMIWCVTGTENKRQ